MSHRIELRQIPHPQCRSCDRAERASIDADGLCVNTTSSLDGLPVRCVGEWAYDKIFRLVQYFGIFAGGMKGQWRGLNYVEICCGPGRCITRNDRTEMDGTALAIVGHRQFSVLERAVFIDASPRVVDILNQRIKVLGAAETATAVVGNYEDGAGICSILARLPDDCLNLVFIDPTECDVPFATIRQIVARLRHADLIINVALGTDVNRNIAPAVLSPSHSNVREKYERFLGVPGFCAKPEVVELAKRADHNDLRRSFAEAYTEQLRGEGYTYTAVRPVKHYYQLIFASRSRKGLEFWDKSCRIAPDNQRELL